MTTLQANEYGFSLPVVTNIDMTSTTDLLVTIRDYDGLRPSNTKELKAGVITAAVTGTVAIPILAGDFPTPGDYFLQVVDVTPGRSIPSSVGLITVLPNVPPANSSRRVVSASTSLA